MAEIARLTPEIEWEQKEEYHPIGPAMVPFTVLGRLTKQRTVPVGITFTESGR